MKSEVLEWGGTNVCPCRPRQGLFIQRHMKWQMYLCSPRRKHMAYIYHVCKNSSKNFFSDVWTKFRKPSTRQYSTQYQYSQKHHFRRPKVATGWSSYKKTGYLHGVGNGASAVVFHRWTQPTFDQIEAGGIPRSYSPAHQSLVGVLSVESNHNPEIKSLTGAT